MLNLDLTKVQQQLSLPKQVILAALVAYLGMAICKFSEWARVYGCFHRSYILYGDEHRSKLGPY